VTWAKELEDLMPDTVYLSTAVASRDGYGVETWSAGRAVKARVVRSVGVRRSNTRGESHPDESVVWIRSSAALSTAARVTIDDVAHPVSRTANYPDEDGHFHVKLFLAWAHRGN
jgi:head-tail adaptor